MAGEQKPLAENALLPHLSERREIPAAIAFK